VIPIKIDGKVDSHALLDSGASGPNLLLSRTLIGKVSVIEERTVETQLVSEQMYSGIGGLEVERCGMMGNIQIGPITYGSTGACFSGSVSPGEAIIGYRFLQNFNMTFDYPDSKIVLEPRKNR
jgi:hypothetical protein